MGQPSPAHSFHVNTFINVHSYSLNASPATRSIELHHFVITKFIRRQLSKASEPCHLGRSSGADIGIWTHARTVRKDAWGRVMKPKAGARNRNYGDGDRGGRGPPRQGGMLPPPQPPLPTARVRDCPEVSRLSDKPLSSQYYQCPIHLWNSRPSGTVAPAVDHDVGSQLVMESPLIFRSVNEYYCPHRGE
ncbi:hypothetical protein EJ06DRAFT_264199 [Trichodelitschia bisporula]|uniref:Uncharacterized protein n=1 Tax=Trichodelitschia bisporula TaxID=703511 RepID=A0A6G1HIS2_9PEZI|nr:hypothetical protein EJ06DRAFT_264199 [Trichodelitschia bisporula]